ncbi:YciI family protein [Falsiroseomonas ponticola]|uniref:YciI family protein n=1 Tax=Falsiroseomonas ponticola TaxID=2786951 RepID=UPI001933415F|nr:YciI family protein [Roseomonas ponticola]
MKVTMLIHEAPEDVAARTDPARAPAYWGAWKAYADALAQTGFVQGGAGLQGPETATLIHGDRVLDGPYSETREQLGGYFTLEVPDLETAKAWAARCPAAALGTIELRPHLVMMG